jgi:hypothetical protein
VLDALISESITTGEINISNSVACFHQPNHSIICKVNTMTKVDVVKVFPQTADCRHSAVSDVSAFSEHEISQLGCSRDDSANGVVPNVFATGEIQNT